MLVLLCNSSKSPNYDGKKLYEWSDQLVAATRSNSPYSQVAREQAVRAIKSIGPKAIPFALDKIQFKRSNLRQQANSILKRLGFRIQKPPPELFVREEGITIFYLIEDSGNSAVPDLLILAQNPNYSQAATRALSCVGPKGVTSLMGLLTNQDSTVRTYALHSVLGFISRNIDSSKALELTIEIVNDSDQTNQNVIADWFQTWSQSFPQLAVHLEALLEHPNPKTRTAAAKAFGFLLRKSSART